MSAAIDIAAPTMTVWAILKTFANAEASFRALNEALKKRAEAS
jgi:hypothetical protein